MKKTGFEAIANLLKQQPLHKVAEYMERLPEFAKNEICKYLFK